MTRKELIEKFCKALNEAELGPFESSVYSEMVFIESANDDEIANLTRELQKLS